MLKRGMNGTIEEWLMAAEHVAQRGNLDIVLCERGIRTFETATRNTLDISAVPVAQRLSHLPVIVDPSHSGGSRDLVLPLTRAAIAIGADGVIIDVHPHPETALCDGPQAWWTATSATSPSSSATCPHRRPLTHPVYGRFLLLRALTALHRRELRAIAASHPTRLAAHCAIRFSQARTCLRTRSRWIRSLRDRGDGWCELRTVDPVPI